MYPSQAQVGKVSNLFDSYGYGAVWMYLLHDRTNVRTYQCTCIPFKFPPPSIHNGTQACQVHIHDIMLDSKCAPSQGLF